MKGAWSDMGAMLGDFRANWRPFLAIHIVVTAVVVVVLGSLASVLLRLAVLLHRGRSPQQRELPRLTVDTEQRSLHLARVGFEEGVPAFYRPQKEQ